MPIFGPIAVALVAVLAFAAGLSIGRANEHRIARRDAWERRRGLFEQEWSPNQN